MFNHSSFYFRIYRLPYFQFNSFRNVWFIETSLQNTQKKNPIVNIMYRVPLINTINTEKWIIHIRKWFQRDITHTHTCTEEYVWPIEFPPRTKVNTLGQKQKSSLSRSLSLSIVSPHHPFVETKHRAMHLFSRATNDETAALHNNSHCRSSQTKSHSDEKKNQDLIDTQAYSMCGFVDIIQILTDFFFFSR